MREKVLLRENRHFYLKKIKIYKKTYAYIFLCNIFKLRTNRRKIYRVPCIKKYYACIYARTNDYLIMSKLKNKLFMRKLTPFNITRTHTRYHKSTYILGVY